MDTFDFNREAKEMRQEMIDDQGYLSCQYCGTSNSIAFEVHHIVYRSEAPHHPNLHNPINLILLCREHHKWFHSKKDRRDELIIERCLWEIFPKIIRKESFLPSQDEQPVIQEALGNQKAE